MRHPVTFAFVTPCVVHHVDPGPVDEYGDHPPAVGSATSTRCCMAQNSRGEDAEIERERWSWYGHPEVALDANDEIDVNGATFQVIGDPWRVIDPVTGRATHLEATVERRR